MAKTILLHLFVVMLWTFCSAARERIPRNSEPLSGRPSSRSRQLGGPSLATTIPATSSTKASSKPPPASSAASRRPRGIECPPRYRGVLPRPKFIPNVPLPCRDASGLCIIPQPSEAIRMKDAAAFRMTSETVLDMSGTLATPTSAREFHRRIYCALGFKLKMRVQTPTPEEAAHGVVTLARNRTLGNDAYVIVVETTRIQIDFGGKGGLLYAFYTLLQMMSPLAFEVSGGPDSELSSLWTVPAARIIDRPRYLYRGLLFDSARHFYDAKRIKSLFDLMAMHKLNRFHWHLTDDQGWRIEVTRHPELMKHGAARGPSMGDRFNGTANANPRYYAQRDIQSIIEYAAELNIEIVPEIDIPAHSGAMIVGAKHAKPPVELGEILLPSDCSGNATNLEFAPNCMEGTQGLLIPDKNTLAYLKDVFTELVNVFRGEFMHIGGNDVKMLRDKIFASDRVQELKAVRNSTDQGLHASLLDRIIRFLGVHDYRVISWEDTFIGLPGFSPPAFAVVMWGKPWINESSWQELPNLPYRVILAPSNQAHIDKNQFLVNEQSPIAVQSGTVTLADAYALGSHNYSNVMGVEGCLYTEALKDWAFVEYQMFPRLAAVAESAWTQLENRNYPSFLQRLEYHKQRLEVMGIAFCKTDSSGNP